MSLRGEGIRLVSKGSAYPCHSVGTNSGSKSE